MSECKDKINSKITEKKNMSNLNNKFIKCEKNNVFEK